jgi:hypothetical protein
MTTITLRRAAPAIGWPLTGARCAFSAVRASVSLVARFMVGSGSGPRGYRREGFPEHELYQVMSGRRDKFERM